MDTKKLMVGQEVWMTLSHVFFQKGKVIDNSFFEQFDPPVYVAEDAVAVEVNDKDKFILLFDTNGKTGTAWDGLGQYDYSDSNGWFQSDPRAPADWRLIDGEPPSGTSTCSWMHTLKSW